MAVYSRGKSTGFALVTRFIILHVVLLLLRTRTLLLLLLLLLTLLFLPRGELSNNKQLWDALMLLLL